MNLYELQEQAKDALAEAMEFVLDASGMGLDELDQDDIEFHDLLDSLVPIYTSDLMELASSYADFRMVGDGSYNTLDDIIMENVYNYLWEYMSDVFDEVKDDLDYQPEIDLLKTSDPRDDYIEQTGDNISLDDWWDCW